MMKTCDWCGGTGITDSDGLIESRECKYCNGTGWEKDDYSCDFEEDKV